MLKNNKWKILISSLIILLPILAGLLLWNRLPDTMVTHWGADGSPDGSMGKALSIFLLPLILLALHLVCLFFTSLDKKQADQDKKALGIVFWIIPCISLFVNGMFYSIALGHDMGLYSWIPALLGVLLLFMGNYLPKVKQNSTLGIKIFWTLYNEENWNKTHRFAGKVWVVCGFVMLLSALLPIGWTVAVMLLTILVVIVLPYVYSYRLYRAHKKAGISYSRPPKSKKEKIAYWVSAVAVTLILIGVAVLMFTGNITYTQDADALTITADYFEDLRVSYEEIDSITYEESSPTAYRTQGFGSPRLSMGTFQNDTLGTHTRYTYTGCDAVIVLTSGDKLLVINCETPEQTLDLYNTLLIAINKA